MKFILTATLTYVPYTILWFFWHNNLFPVVYYTSNIVNTISSQNVWVMNFANAMLAYGFVYFYFRSVKTDTKLVNAMLWGAYYYISAIGFYSFMNFGVLRGWSLGVLIHDMIFAVFGGGVSGVLVYYLHSFIKPIVRTERTDGYQR